MFDIISFCVCVGVVIYTLKQVETYMHGLNRLKL